jgi:hypothetical protein
MTLEESLVSCEGGRGCGRVKSGKGRVRQWGTAFRPLDEIFFVNLK